NYARRTYAVGDYGPPAVSTAGIEWSTYLGGNELDEPKGVAVDAEGNILVIGTTRSSGWVSGGFDVSLGGTNDVFVVKLSPSGAHLWSTYLGGSKDDSAGGIAVDSAGSVLVTGYTQSDGWVSGGYDASCGCGFNAIGTSGYSYGDAFVVKLSPSGTHLWSTYVGGDYNAHTTGSGDDAGTGIAVDKAGNVLVSGSTGSSGWVSGGLDTSYNASDGFVVKLSPNGAHLWSTYVGGDFMDYAECIAVDGAGNVLVGGRTYPVLSNWIEGGYDTSFNGGFSDGFVLKLSPDGALVWSTYVGGTGSDSCDALAVDRAGNVLVTGGTASAGWVRGGFSTTFTDETSSYIVKISAAGQHLWSTYVAGNGTETAHGIAVDEAGNVLVTGSDRTYHGPYYVNVFLTKLTASGQLLGTTYVGNDKAETREVGVSVAMDRSGNIVLAGTTDSGGWMSGGFDTNYHGKGDTFVARIPRRDVGVLSVTITPPEACNAGAGWRRAGTSRWRDSDEVEYGVPAGPCAIEFSNPPGWYQPADQSVLIRKDDVTVATVTYVPHTGSLQVTIGPPQACDAGAKWRRLGSLPWHNSDETETGVPIGKYLVEFRDTPGFSVPIPPRVAITKDATTRISAAYAHGHDDVSLVWSTCLAWNRHPAAFAVATDAAGNVLVTGSAFSGSADEAIGGVSTNHHGSDDAFVAKFSPQGSLLWRSYLGGAGADEGRGIVADSEGNVLVTGSTSSTNWVSGGFDTNYHGGGFYSYDVFVAKLSPSGAHLWSTYLGGRGDDEGHGIAVDAAGNVLVAGETDSTSWVRGGFDTNYNGGYVGDAFVVKLAPSGAHLWSTYLGGSDTDGANGLAVDGAGNVFVAGRTQSAGWVSGGFDSDYGDARVRAFVAKLSPVGEHLWSTYMGGHYLDQAHAVAVDGAGDVFVTGETYSTNWAREGWLRLGPRWTDRRLCREVELGGAAALVHLSRWRRRRGCLRYCRGRLRQRGGDRAEHFH
ncbi:MAG: SBBP repeat-containing protein, partial [Verrucomicrobiota bacterium]